MKAKCVRSIRVKLADGGSRTFTAGVIYDVSELREDTVKAHFEAPEIAPPKKQTRTVKESGES